MDIRELLSPQDSPAAETPPQRLSPSPHASPNRYPSRPSGQQRKSSGLSTSITLSPTHQAVQLPSIVAHSNHQHLPVPSAGVTSHPQPTHSGPQMQHSPYNQPTESGANPAYLTIHKQSSTPQMDKLAELASMQHHHQQQQHGAGQNSNGPHNAHPPDAQRFSLRSHFPHSVSARSAPDLAATEGTPSKAFATSALSDAECEHLAELHAHLAANPFDFQSHVSFINLLHKGFHEHVNSGQDPLGYELVEDLRHARGIMDNTFAVGEDTWMAWFQDEMLLAQDTDQRIALIQLFEHAVRDEPNSSALWRLYGDYWYHLWATANEQDAHGWSDVDKAVGKEVFQWDSMIQTWESGVGKTRWRLNDSNVIWDRYMEILLEDEFKRPSPDKADIIRHKFLDRLLKEPHATWEQTAQAFSSFITSHYPDSYENIMVEVTRQSTQVKNMYRQREPFESKIDQAKNSLDPNAEWLAYSRYLEWEITAKGPFSFPMINGLFERATTRFATDARFWTDYVEFLMQNPQKDVSLRDVLERATRHCPWSGDLWSHRLLTLEAEGEKFPAIEEVKHTATKTGMLDAGGMEELIKVSLAWCGCLRRRAFEPSARDDELDVAEMGIRSALEHVRKIGERRYGNQYQGDPQYRLERIHIKFLTQRGELDLAREAWNALIKAQANSYEFWCRYYIWEMVAWAEFSTRTSSEPEHQLRTPIEATAILSEALKHHETMDWPEQLVQMYLNHCEQHESIHHLRTAIIEVRKISTAITKRREKENAERVALYQQQPQQTTEPTAPETERSGKRKRCSDAGSIDQSSKKVKADEAPAEFSSSNVLQTKRDREHAVIIVKKLPPDTAVKDVRQFFMDCGTILDIKLVNEDDHQRATVEFETQAEALFAQSRTSKLFQGRNIEIDLGTGTTLWVANYPPAASEQYIRDLFKKYGEILEVRLPSLINNAHRRFCYVQFATSTQAVKATELDGLELEDGGEKFQLKAKISDPSQKDSRQGPIYEGRQVFAKNLHFHAVEDEVKKFFEKCGPVESVRIPLNAGGKSKGFAFITYEESTSAETAVEKLDKSTFRGRPIHVEISQQRSKGTATIIHRGSVTSMSPEHEPQSAVAEMSRDANGNDRNERNAQTTTTTTTTTARSRTIAIMNIPDTVPSARIENLLEPYGAVKKFTLRPDHAGAIVEFVDEKSAGLAGLGLADRDLDGRKLRIGTVPELLKQQPMNRTSRMDQAHAASKKEKEVAATSAPFAGSMVSRPGSGTRRGRRGTSRGGLGYQRTGFGSGASRDKVDEGGQEKSGSMSNEDFRAMLLGGKKDATGQGAETSDAKGKNVNGETTIAGKPVER